MRKIFDAGLKGYKILQFPSTTPSQNMGYLIVTPQNKVIVVDGGIQGDAQAFAERIKAFSNEVEAWILNHAHDDHIGAFTALMQSKALPEIKNLYFDFPPLEWLRQKEPGEAEKVELFFELIENYKGKITKPQKNSELKVDGLRLLFLTQYEKDEAHKIINDTSVVFKVYFPEKTALFLADASVPVGHRLLAECRNKLKSDIVQMAHHGQSGVTEDVYKAASPDICLWPTPKWLWENDIGAGPGSGPWKTLETRQWAENVGAKHHLVSKDAEYLLV